MTITPGTPIPSATFLRMVDGDPQPVESSEIFGKGRTIVFAMPGAYTSTCSAVHLPGVVKYAHQITEKGADRIVVLTTNDPFVAEHWGAEAGATDAGVIMLADASAEFTKALGVDFSVPSRGLIDRSARYAMIVEDGVITSFTIEEGKGTCDMTGGAAILDML